MDKKTLAIIGMFVSLLFLFGVVIYKIAVDKNNSTSNKEESTQTISRRTPQSSSEEQSTTNRKINFASIEDANAYGKIPMEAPHEINGIERGKAEWYVITEDISSLSVYYGGNIIVRKTLLSKDSLIGDYEQRGIPKVVTVDDKEVTLVLNNENKVMYAIWSVNEYTFTIAYEIGFDEPYILDIIRQVN